MKRIILITSILLSSQGYALANSDNKEINLKENTCEKIIAKKGTVYNINSNIDVGTRIVFPAIITEHMVSLGGELWDVKSSGKNIWVRPKTEVLEGNKTGMTVIVKRGSRKTTYDFIVNSAKKVKKSCYIISNYIPKVVKKRSKTKNIDNKLIQEITQNYEKKILILKKLHTKKLHNMHRQFKAQAQDLISDFTYRINTAYEWSSGDISYPQIVQAVYDDGRFTYLRIKTTGYGLPSVVGISGNEKFVLQSEYDDLTGVFSIQGLYDGFLVKYDRKELIVKRMGN